LLPLNNKKVGADDISRYDLLNRDPIIDSLPFLFVPGDKRCSVLNTDLDYRFRSHSFRSYTPPFIHRMYPFRKANVSASSPISSLPVELLSEIFSLCVLSADDQERKTDGSEYSPPAITSESIRIPLVLSSVNRRWREVALNQSSLWSNICVTAELLDDLFDHRGSGYSKSAKLNPTHITTYLTRSRHHPIHILIDGRDPDWDFSEPECVLLLSFLSTSFLSLSVSGLTSEQTTSPPFSHPHI